MEKIIRIVAAVVDTRQLTMYKEDGSTVLIPQGDPRLRRVLEVATPLLQSQGWADVDISEITENSYADFQEQSKGIRFFRVAKDKLRKLFKTEDAADTEPVPDLTVGQVPVPPSPAVPAAPASPVGGTTAPVAPEWEVEAKDGLNKDDDAQDAARDEAAAAAEVTEAVAAQPVAPESDDQAETFEPVVNQVPEMQVKQTLSVVDEIIANAVPVNHPDFNETGIVKQRPMAVGGVTSNDHPDETAEHTMIAVVGNKVIPGVELIKSQFGHAAKMGSTQGVENFLKRLGTVIESRSHSVEDLLKFMERADLPIADDGTIIIYKVLRRSGDVYVDCHTQKVRQWVGAYVCMDPSLVDHNRNNECSNGLHVARRGYISGFSGDVCVLAKLAPEDVITIPTYDANKMRVCGYHILKELPQGLYSLLKSNRSITSTDDGKRILADAICGKHTRKTHEVRITAGHGGGVIVKEIAKDVEPPPVLTPEAPKQVETLPEDHAVTDTPIAPAEVEQVTQVALSKREQAQALYNEWLVAKEKYTAEVTDAALQRLKDFKKAAKKGWDVLGITDPAVTGGTTAPASKVEAKQPAKAAPAKATKPAPPPVQKPLPVASEGSPRERIAKLMEIGLDSQGVAQKVYDIKKASKKSWENLGLTEAQSIKVLKAIGKVTE